MNTAATYSFDRYQRQMILPDFGTETQSKLAAAKLLVVGAGGLGCPVLQYLAAAGVGRLGIADDDQVSLHNLHRQILYQEADIGQLKVTAAAARLLAMNSQIRIDPIAERINISNALAYFKNYDIIIDGSDNFPTRYLINDAAVLCSKPLVYGAVSGFEGQVTVFTPNQHYRDLFPIPPEPGSIPDCEEAGVLGLVPGLIGMMMAQEAIKLITGIGNPLEGRLLLYNTLTNRQTVLNYNASVLPHADMPETETAFKMHDYVAFCKNNIRSISPEALQQSMRNELPLFIDIRERSERPAPVTMSALQLPLSSFDPAMVPRDNRMTVFFCQSGRRTESLFHRYPILLDGSLRVYSLQGGLDAWLNYQKSNGTE